MALGVMLVVAILLVHGVVQQSFRTNDSLGYNMIVGPKGGKLQLALNTVYYLSEPVENIPYEYYLDFLTAEEVQRLHDPAELEQVIERRNRQLTRGQLEYLAARWLNSRLDEQVAYDLLSNWWRKRPEEARQKDAEKQWDKYGQGQKEAIAKEAFVAYATGDLANPPSPWAKEEFLDLARKTFRERFVKLVVAWRTDNITDKQRPFFAQFGLDERFKNLLRLDLLDGPYSREIDEKTPNLAIPVCLGDYYKQYRVVGTSTKMFDELEYKPDEGKKYEFAAGRNFKYWDEEHGFFEAVVGATVAREYKLKLGDKLVAAHGAAETDEAKMHTESAFTVVGILRPSGTPNDRAVFVNMEGFYLMEGHAKPVEESEQSVDAAAAEGASAIDGDHAAEDDKGEAAGGDDQALSTTGKKTPRKDPLPLDEREVTAILFRCREPFATMAHENAINEGQVAQVVQPTTEITVLFDMIVTPIQTLLLIITAMICVVSGMSILVSIYNSMTERKHEIAVMRALGAGRTTVMAIVLLESIIISIAGGLLGWVGGHLLVTSASGYIERQTGVTIGLFDFAPAIALQSFIGMGDESFRQMMATACLGLLVLAVAATTAILAEFLLRLGGKLRWDAYPAVLRRFLAALPSIAMLLIILTLAAFMLALAGPSIEFLIVPPLLLLAIIVGFLPALTAYRTDVAKSLQ